MMDDYWLVDVHWPAPFPDFPPLIRNVVPADDGSAAVDDWEVDPGGDEA